MVLFITEREREKREERERENRGGEGEKQNAHELPYETSHRSHPAAKARLRNHVKSVAD